jgi:hypothetical protein
MATQVRHSKRGVNFDPSFRSEWCHLDIFDVNDDVIGWYLLQTVINSLMRLLPPFPLGFPQEGERTSGGDL